MFSRLLKTSIFDLQTSFGGQNRSEYYQEHNCDNTKVEQDKMDALKLTKYTFQVRKVPKNIFSPSLEVLK